MTKIENKSLELLKEDINDRLYELQGLSQAMELFFSECDLERMKKERFDPGLLFAIQKRLYTDLHTQFQNLIN